jgi:signal transduction histidine kinase
MSKDDAQERTRTEQLARLGALVAAFAHEVRNPLSTIGLNLQLVKEDFADADTARDKRTYKRLSVVEAEVRRLQTIVDEFLRFARMPGIQRAPTDVNALLQAVVDFSAPELARRGIALRFFAGPGVEVHDVDSDQLRAVVVNLVRNAGEACRTGDQVLVSSRREGDRIVLQVTDTGAGMNPDVLARVFEPYFSTKISGTGLGLPSVRRIVEQHGGVIDVTSEPGKGTQFTITLPATAAAAGGGERLSGAGGDG